MGFDARLQVYILDRKGKPKQVSPSEFQRWAEVTNRVVADTSVGPIRIITSFGGIDYSFGLSRPILWETSVFNDDTWIVPLMRRYTSAGLARKGHADLVSVLLQEQEQSRISSRIVSNNTRRRVLTWAKTRGTA